MNRRKKILYAGPLGLGGTCYSRYVGLTALNVEVEPFDTDQWLDLSFMTKVQRWVELISLHGPAIAQINREFTKVFEEFGPDVVWMDKAYWLWPNVISRLRTRETKWIHHNTDYLNASPLSMRISRRLMRKTADMFDVLLTTNHKDFEMYHKSLGHKVLFTQLGYDGQRFDNTPLPNSLKQRWSQDAVFVGHYEPRTEEYVNVLAESGIDIRVYGDTKWKTSNFGRRFPERIGSRLTDEEYVYALKGARIGLCIFSEFNHNQSAGRSFEIPASGTFLLALRSKQHQQFYKEGLEAEFFTSKTEAVLKVRHYLDYPEERCKIATNGYRRCIDSGYSWSNIMIHDWMRVMTACGL